MQSVSDDDVRKRLLEQPRIELAATIQTGKMLRFLAGRFRSSSSLVADTALLLDGADDAVPWRMKCEKSCTPLEHFSRCAHRQFSEVRGCAKLTKHSRFQACPK